MLFYCYLFAELAEQQWYQRGSVSLKVQAVGVCCESSHITELWSFESTEAWRMLSCNTTMLSLLYHSLAKEWPWVEHLTGLPNRGWVLF